MIIHKECLQCLAQEGSVHSVLFTASYQVGAYVRSYEITQPGFEHVESALCARIRAPWPHARPNPDIRPPNPVPPIRNDAEGFAVLVSMRWGLLPYWSKEPKAQYASFNARAETIDSQPMFRIPFQQRRCLIPAHGSPGSGALAQRPELMTREAFLAVWAGRLILITRRAPIGDPNRRFGIGWLVGAVQKYRIALSEVLVTSFFLCRCLPC